MSAKELLEQCSNFCQTYFDQNIDQMHASIFGNLENIDNQQEFLWKALVNCFQASCKTSVMLTLTFLIANNLIDIGSDDIPVIRL